MAKDRDIEFSSQLFQSPLRTSRLCECAMNGPATSESGTNYRITETSFCSPIGNTQCYSTKLYEPIVAAIPGLGVSRCPSAISRLVMSVVISSVKRHAGWAGPHVGKKIFKFHPAKTQSDSTAAVSVVSRIARVVAPFLGVSPRLHGSTFRVAVGALVCFAPISEQAPATSGMARAKFVSVDRYNRATLALAFPKKSVPPFIPSNEFGDSKPPECFSANVYESTVCRNKLRISHDGTSKLGCEVVRAGSCSSNCSARFIVAFSRGGDNA